MDVIRTGNTKPFRGFIAAQAGVGGTAVEHLAVRIQHDDAIVVVVHHGSETGLADPDGMEQAGIFQGHGGLGGNRGQQFKLVLIVNVFAFIILQGDDAQDTLLGVDRRGHVGAGRGAE